MSLIQREGLKFFQDTLEEMNGVLDFENYSYKVFSELLKIRNRHYEFTSTFKSIVGPRCGVVNTARLSDEKKIQIANCFSSVLEDEVGDFTDKDKLQINNRNQDSVESWNDFILFLLDFVGQSQISEFKNRETLIKLFFGIVACGGSVENCDKLASVSGVQGRGTRSLYQLDLREGFLRFVLYWNEAFDVGNTKRITYIKAIDMLPEIEKELTNGAKEKLKNIDNLFAFRGLSGVNEKGEIARLRDRAENIRVMLNSGETIDLSAVHSELERILRRLAQIDENGNIQQSDDSFQQATRVMNEGTRAWENAVQKIAESIAESDGEFDTAKKQYIKQAIESIGERNLTAMSIIVSAINTPDRYMKNIRYFASNYDLKSRRERGVTPTGGHPRLSRALDPAEILKAGNLNAIEMMMNPRLSNLCSFKTEDVEYILSLFYEEDEELFTSVEFDPQSINIPKIMLPSGSDIANKIAGYCTIFDSGFEHGMIVNVERKSLLKFALAAGFSTVEEVKDILSLSGDRNFNLNDKTEAFVYMVLVYLEHLKSKEVCVLDYMRQAETLLMRYLAREVVNEELKAYGTDKEELINNLINEEIARFDSIALYDRPTVLKAKSDEYDKFCISFYILASIFSLLMGETMKDACEQTICSTGIGDAEISAIAIDEDSFKEDFEEILKSEGDQVKKVLILINKWIKIFSEHIRNGILSIDKPVIELFSVMTDRISNLCDFMKIAVEILRKKNRAEEADELLAGCEYIDNEVENARLHFEEILNRIVRIRLARQAKAAQKNKNGKK